MAHAALMVSLILTLIQVVGSPQLKVQILHLLLHFSGALPSRASIPPLREHSPLVGTPWLPSPRLGFPLKWLIC